MSASDNLNEKQFRLFHGTSAKIKPGEKVYPGDASANDEIDEETGKHHFDTPRSRFGEDLAFASSHLTDAASYGRHVYEVHANPEDSNLEYHGSDVYGHPEGFTVKREIPSKVVTRYAKIMTPIKETKETLEHGKWMHKHGMIEHSGGGKVDYHISYDKTGNQVKVPVESHIHCSECKKIK